MGEVITGKALAVNAPGAQRPYLRTKNVFDGRIDVNDVLTMPMTDAEFDRFRIVPGDVLLNEGQSLELVGRCAIYRGEYQQPCAIQNQLLRFRARAGVSAEFATHLFRYSQARGVFARIALQTTSIAHLGRTRFERLPLPWPASETEQGAIAEALSDVDELLAALEALIAKKLAIKQAVMQQLLTGKTRLPGFSGGWKTKRLGEISTIAIGRTPSRANTACWGPGHVWLSIADLHGKIVRSSKEQITDLAASGMNAVPRGTLLMSFKLSIGRLCFAGCELFTNEAICSFTDLRADADFLYYALSRTDFSLYGTQTVKGYTLNRESLKQVQVLLPDRGEQAAIAAVLSDIDSEIETIEARREKTRAIKEGMMQQLLTGRVRLVKPSPAEATA
jgi:type I restriction enzyme S subunit